MGRMQKITENLVFILILSYNSVVGVKMRNKFVYEKEISEHCVRRVMPSVFLGRHVVDAYSQILYFSKVDLPYSCYVSVRAESGSNIILVVQLLSADDLISSCAKNPNQLLVYEMGETFGGYWGPIPQNFVQQDRNSTKRPRPEIYTIKYTQTRSKSRLKTNISTVNNSSSEVNQRSTERPTTPNIEEQNYMTVMVPLVNISGKYVPGEDGKESAFENENFDIIYDVLPSLPPLPKRKWRRSGATNSTAAISSKRQFTNKKKLSLITNRRGEHYVTTMMPLVQFSVGAQPGSRRWGYEDLMSGYSFGQHFNTFTPDYRLKHQKYNEKINRILKFKHNVSKRPSTHQNKTLFDAFCDVLINQNIIQPKQHSNYVPIDDITTKTVAETKIKEDRDWIEELISSYNKTGSLTTISDDELQQDFSELINKLNLNNYNQSAYLNFPRSTNKLDFSTKTTIYPLTRRPIMRSRHEGDTVGTDYPDYTEEKNTKSIITLLTKSTTMANSVENFQENGETTNNLIGEIVTTESLKEVSYNFTTMDTIELTKTTENILLNASTINTTKHMIVEPTRIHKLRTPLMTGSLLDHESWENLLLAAPEMAGRLYEKVPQKIMEQLENTSDSETNASVPLPNSTESMLGKIIDSKISKKRKKRFIQGIMIEDAKPRRLTTKVEEVTTTSSSIHISDVQQFAQLVELIDDDIHDRAALRYLRQYVGQPMFNLCSFDQPKPRYVHLFKSSRLVIAVGNFTLRSMQLVVTPAKMLFTGKSRCEQSHLECQVAGNRVCIDSMSACDGVANCGAPDIYDEDRLMCGAYVGLQHNVCLAAITFLAVLLTLIYMVHYWLGRCVPKVSEAFFIYTEGDENILFLDTIMRSPHEMDEGPFSGKSIEKFDTDAMFVDTYPETKIHSWLHKLLPCCFKRKDKRKSISMDWDEVHLSPTNTMFSFPELEIRRMINPDHKDICVQTGESLEMKIMPSIEKTSREIGKGFDSSPEPRTSVMFASPVSSDEKQRVKDELNLLKAMNKKRYDSLTTHTSYNLVKYEPSYTEMSSINEPDETELQNQFYDPRWQDRSVPQEDQERIDYSLKYDNHADVEKPTKCLRFSEDVVNIPRIEDSYEETSTLKMDNGNFSETVDEPNASTSRDFMRFWGGSKGKKPKKKIQTLNISKK